MTTATTSPAAFDDAKLNAFVGKMIGDVGATLTGALARTTESANNIASILTVPLAFLSDAYIPIDRFPHAVSATLRLLPSTQFIETFRDVSVYGAPLAAYGAWLAALVLWTIAGAAISARTFRWV